MALQEDISIDQGTDYRFRLELVETDGSKKNLTGYTAAGKIKETYNTSDSDAIEFAATFPAPRTDGILLLDLTNTQTDLLTENRYVYDVEISYFDSDSDQVVERIIQGKVDVSPSVT